MSSLKNKLKIKTGIKKQIEKENSGNKQDMRILNYFDLKDNERMRVLFVPSEGDGSLYYKWRMHGPRLGIRGVKPIRCMDEANNGRDCPMCQQAFSLLEEGKEDGNDYDTYKEEAKKWFPKDYTLSQCIVLESPMEINEDDEGNIVKLFYMPWSVEEKIREGVLEGVVEEDDICFQPFVIKNTKNGKFNNYKNSYFVPKMVDEDTLEALDDFTANPFDLPNVDIVGSVPTQEECEKWLEETIPMYNKEMGFGDDDEEEPPKKEEKKSSGASLQDRLKAKQSKQEDEDSSGETDEAPWEEDKEEEPEDESPKKSSGADALRNRLMNARK